MTTDADRQRFEDELRRCELLSAEVKAPCPPGPVTPNNDARYYAERGRILRRMGVDRAVAFLREETLAALAGTKQGKINRWFILARLDKFGDVTPSYEALARSTIVDLLDAGVGQLTPDVLQVVITHAWEQRARKAEELRQAALSCDWCIGDQCDGACM